MQGLCSVGILAGRPAGRPCEHAASCRHFPRKALVMTLLVLPPWTAKGSSPFEQKPWLPPSPCVPRAQARVRLEKVLRTCWLAGQVNSPHGKGTRCLEGL